jgi:hypothetical protein
LNPIIKSRALRIRRCTTRSQGRNKISLLMLCMRPTNIMFFITLNRSLVACWPQVNSRRRVPYSMALYIRKIRKIRGKTHLCFRFLSLLLVKITLFRNSQKMVLKINLRPLCQAHLRMPLKSYQSLLTQAKNFIRILMTLYLVFIELLFRVHQTIEKVEVSLT